MRIRLFLLALLTLASTVHAESELTSVENLSKELVVLREQIDSLNSQISDEKLASKERMRSFVNQKADLEVRISRTDLNVKDLQRELEHLQERKRAQSRGSEVLLPMLQKSFAALRQSIEQSLPFKRQARLDALSEIEQRLNNKIITPNKAANQLWAFVEDELMLGRSSGIYTDTLEISGQPRLVKVLRIGKVALFYQGGEQEYGVIRRNGSEWQQDVITASETVAQLDYLFDSFAKNIHSGQFTIPNIVPKR